MTASATSDSTLLRAASGYRATLLSHGVRVVCKIVGVVVLARVVSPADHGRFAMAATVTFLLMLFRDLGTSAAAIQAPGLTDGQMTALFWLHSLLGFALATATLLLARPAAMFFVEPQLVSLLSVMSIGFVLSGASSWPRTLLNRELRFRELNRLETAGAVLGTAAMIIAGLLHAGAYAFAVFLLVSEMVMLVMAWWFCAWRPRHRADWQRTRDLAGTGFHLTGYHLLLYALQQADAVLMGRWFGAVALGLYNRAGQLLVQPATHLTAPFGQVLLSTLSRLGPASPAFAQHFRATTNIIAYFTLPVATVCLVLPDEIVRVVLGTAWPDASPLLRWLAMNAAVSFLSSTVYALCVASGHSRRLVQLAAVTLPVTLLALWLGRPHGPVGLAAGVAVANLLLFVPRLWWAARRTAVTLRDFIDAFFCPVMLSVVLALGAAAGRYVARDAAVWPRVLIAAACGFAAVAVAFGVWRNAREELRERTRHFGVGVKEAHP